MIDKFLLLVPTGFIPPIWAILGALVVGTILWIAGSRLSRSLFTLGFVAIGCLLGRRAPMWFDLNVPPTLVAVSASIVFGILGYSLHRWWAGICLGLLMALWAALALWAMYGPSTWTWPLLDSLSVLPAYLRDLWFNLPADIAHPLPIICGTSFIAGLTATLLFPRVGVIVLHSLLGSTLLLTASLLLAQTRYPQALTKLPEHQWAQASLIFTLVLLGMALQWKLRPRHRTTQPPPPAED